MPPKHTHAPTPSPIHSPTRRLPVALGKFPALRSFLRLRLLRRWPHTLIPVLPASLVHYLEAPVPFLMGMHLKGLERVGADLSCVTMVNLVRRGGRFVRCFDSSCQTGWLAAAWVVGEGEGV